jgi:hypothetical protein
MGIALNRVRRTFKIAGNRTAYNPGPPRSLAPRPPSEGTRMSLFKPSKWPRATPSWVSTSSSPPTTNPNKVNLGVGVYYDDNGKLPLLECVQKAEKRR